MRAGITLCCNGITFNGNCNADVHQALVHVWVKASSGGGWQLQTSVSMDGIAGTVKGTDVGFTRCCQERGPVGLA